ncbi:MAG TPA: hypothetical protein VKA44_07920, partial [Gemmatimonadota bacterium]|nr:hypothetical protein [Gemmatimonadota bacterium]
MNDTDRHPGIMDQRPMQAVVISTDNACLDAAREALAGLDDMELGLELPVAFTEIADPHLDRLRRLEPAMIILDLESDPRV